MSAAARASCGRAAEEAARAWLEAQGLELIAANVAGRVGELDLVMRDRAGILVIVEVRSRASDRWGGAAGSVTPAKQRRIAAATGLLLRRRPELARLRIRFDVLAMTAQGDGWRYEWLRDAFRT